VCGDINSSNSSGRDCRENTVELQGRRNNGGSGGNCPHKINTVGARPPRLHGLIIFTFSPQ